MATEIIRSMKIILSCKLDGIKIARINDINDKIDIINVEPIFIPTLADEVFKKALRIKERIITILLKIQLKHK